MTGAIITNGYFENDAIVQQRETLKNELLKLGAETDIIKHNEIDMGIKNGEVYAAVKPYDFIVYLDKDVNIASMLEKRGYFLVNRSESIAICDDKMKTYIALSGNGIPMPETYSAPIMYYDAVDVGFCKKIVSKLSFPIIVKEAYGSMGRGVHKADNLEELIALHGRFKLMPHLYQEMIGKGGKDVRVIVIGGKAVASMERKNESDFRSNIENGGKGFTHALTENEKKLAENAASVLKLEYAGVDIISNGNKDYICEVNSNAFFKGIMSVTGVNIAEIYAERIINLSNQLKNVKKG